MTQTAQPRGANLPQRKGLPDGGRCTHVCEAAEEQQDQQGDGEDVQECLWEILVEVRPHVAQIVCQPGPVDACRRDMS